ncbi:fungal-specific transcription factor domain-containing protein [Flagelloscypha sp. PMI_526]|nr:fungal-specific transcription factor domain-containing protein [Flagelloscypha sp. PMI_526]
MSSSEDEYDVPATSSKGPKMKKRRLAGACDACRKKKTKCDSAEKPNNICTNCTTLGIECKHDVPYKLQRLHPDRDLLAECEVIPPSALPPPLTRATPAAAGSTPHISNPSTYLPNSQPSDNSHSSAVASTTNASSDDEIDVRTATRLKNMKLEIAHMRFWGKGSNFALLKEAMDMKDEFEGCTTKEGCPGPRPIKKRQRFWEISSWERSLLKHEAQKPLHFPPLDLMQTLIHLYMRNVNMFFPLLHAPMFWRDVNANRHMKDFYFGRVVLLVCALGSRYSDDERVLVGEGKNGRQEGDTLTAGFAWFSQVHIMQTRLLFDVMTLLDVQALCLAMLYNQGMTVPQGCWMLLALALRGCHERGIHVRLPGGGKTTKTYEDELWKRAFWFLVAVDRQLTTFSGRPSNVSAEDIEVDYPTECDDEYWIIHPNGDVTFKQPPNKPSVATGFCVHLRLCELYAVSMRTLFASSRSRALFGGGVGGDEWENKIVTELDSSLNRWLDGVPDHLRWDPKRENPVFFDQSCLIYIIYYGLQIQIHRPFINKKGSPLAFPSLAICTNSARSCAHVLDANAKRGSMRLPMAMMTANASSYVLLMNVYGAKRLGIALDLQRNFIDMLFSYLSQCDKHWHIAGRFADIVVGLSAPHIEAALSGPHTSLKRARSREEAFGIGSGQFPHTNTSGSHPMNQDVYSSGYEYPDPAPPPSSVPYRQQCHHISASSSSEPRCQTSAPTLSGAPSSNGSSSNAPSPPEWHISPYAFPAMPGDVTAGSGGGGVLEVYPEFYVEPEMKQGAFGFEALERISNAFVLNHQGGPGHFMEPVPVLPSEMVGENVIGNNGNEMGYQGNFGGMSGKVDTAWSDQNHMQYSNSLMNNAPMHPDQTVPWNPFTYGNDGHI